VDQPSSGRADDGAGTPSTTSTIPPDPGDYGDWLRARGIADTRSMPSTKVWALNSQWQAERTAHHRAVADALVADVRARHETVLPPGMFDLLLDLVEHADARHEPVHYGCNPVVPDDCRSDCPACDLVRPVADDVLRAARARRDGCLR